MEYDLNDFNELFTTLALIKSFASIKAKPMGKTLLQAELKGPSVNFSLDNYTKVECFG